MKVIKPPSRLEKPQKSIFLAGSIEQDKAINWQNYIIENLKISNITILNPRRDNWDSNWKQIKQNKIFHEQVSWELEALELSDLIIMYFDPTTKSPISLLEFGLYAQSHKLIVCCPEGFWRKGNVDIVCERYSIPQKKNIDELIEYAHQYFLGKNS